MFTYEFCETFKNTFFTKHLWKTASFKKINKFFRIFLCVSNFKSNEKVLFQQAGVLFKSFNFGKITNLRYQEAAIWDVL